MRLPQLREQLYANLIALTLADDCKVHNLAGLGLVDRSSPGKESPDFGDLRRRRPSPGPCMIANRSHTRGFRAILRAVRIPGD